MYLYVLFTVQMCFSAERDAINIINNGMPKLNKDETPSGSIHSAGVRQHENHSFLHFVCLN